MKIKDFLNRQSNLECTMTTRNWFVKEPETNKKTPTKFHPRAHNFTALNRYIWKSLS